MYSLNQVIAKIQEFETNHQRINSFSEGELEDVAQLTAVQYPAMFAIVKPSRVEDKALKLVITILFMDLVNTDNSNRLEVHSDTMQDAFDCRAYLMDPANEEFFIFSDNDPIQFDPFTERFVDNVAGWAVDFTFEIIDLKDRCQIPLKSLLPVVDIYDGGINNNLIDSIILEGGIN